MSTDFDARLDRNYGLLEEDQLRSFKEAVLAIKGLSKFSEFFQRANYPISHSDDAFNLVKSAYENALERGYWHQRNNNRINDRVDRNLRQ